MKNKVLKYNEFTKLNEAEELNVGDKFTSSVFKSINGIIIDGPTDLKRLSNKYQDLVDEVDESEYSRSELNSSRWYVVEMTNAEDFIIVHSSEIKLDENLNERRKITLKRRYTEKYPAVTAGFRGPIRNNILNFVSESENGKVTRTQLKEFIMMTNETEGTKTTFSWVNKNKKYFNIYEENGEKVYELSKFGKRILKKTIISD